MLNLLLPSGMADSAFIGSMMLLLIFILFIVGFAGFYQASQKVSVNNSSPGKWLNNHPKVSRLIGTMLFIYATWMSIQELGFAVGIFFSIVALLAVSSLFIVIIPLRLLKTRGK